MNKQTPKNAKYAVVGTPDPLDARKAIAAALAVRRARYEAPACLSLEEVGSLLELMLQLLFPHFGGGCPEGHDLECQLETMIKKLTPMVEALLDTEKMSMSGEQLIARFVGDLPLIADRCHEDALTLLENDPAAESLDEVILSYPGFYAVATYRLAHALVGYGLPLLPRLMSEYVHQRTGIDIHPGARIGRRFFIDHGTGVVIGGTAVIGNNVKIYQGVTIGALRVDRNDRTTKRHPTLEDDVVVYASATILGGETVVGSGSIVGGNVWLTRSVVPGSRVMFKGTDTEAFVPSSSRPS